MTKKRLKQNQGMDWTNSFFYFLILCSGILYITAMERADAFDKNKKCNDFVIAL